jgi:hypothetical protein
MADKYIRPMDVRKIKVKIDDGTIISGKINLRSEYVEGAEDGYPDNYSSDAGMFYNRVSDWFIKGKRSFIVMFDIEAKGFKEGDVIIINKNKICWVVPED